MEEAMAARYWCHLCQQVVNPIIEVDLNCPFCQSGFIEEISSSNSNSNSTRDNNEADSDGGSDRALSLWAPILLGMMGNPRRRSSSRRNRRHEFPDDDDDDNNANYDTDTESRHAGDTELDRELDSIMRRRRRSSATILQLLQGIRAGMVSESDNSNSDNDREREQRERVILINPFNQTIIVQGSYDSNRERGHQTENHSPIGSLGDYFIGPGLDLLLQHLAENDPNRYGTPPAQKDAIEALPTVTIKENLQCSVCLDDFEVGSEAKQMPCKHKFHNGCILPWLELHSSCPVCRFQLPADEPKRDSDGISRNITSSSSSSSSSTQRERERESGHGHGSGEEGDGEGRSANGRRFSIPWPFNNLFSSSGTQSAGGNSSSTSSSSSANASGSGNAFQRDEN